MGPTPSDAWLKRGHEPGCIEDKRKHLPANPTPHKHGLPFQLPDNTEACDGIDNDRDGNVDEVCLDRDDDGAVDLMDDCPDTANPHQLDSDRDHRGDACSGLLVGPDELEADLDANGTVTLSWQPVDGAEGHTVHRHEDNQTTYLGEDYPSTDTTSFSNANASEAATYVVHPVSQATGEE